MKRHLRPRYLGPGDLLTARAVFWILLAVYTATLATPHDDLESELLVHTAQSLAANQSGRLDFSGPGAERLAAARGRLLEEGRLIDRGDGGLAWSADPGNALSAAPFALIGQWIGRATPGIERRFAELDTPLSAPLDTLARDQYLRRGGFFARLAIGWRDALMAAATAYLIALGVLRLGRTRRQAFGVALAFGLCSMQWVAARAPNEEMQAAFLTTLSTYALFAVRERYLRFERPPFGLLLALGGALSGLVLTRADLALTALGLAALGMWVIARGRRRLWSSPLMKARAGTSGALRDILWLSLPALLALAGSMFFVAGAGRLAREGLDNALGPLRLAPAHELLDRAGLLLISPGMGLVWFAPLLLLTPLGIWRHRHDRVLVRASLWVSATVLWASLTRVDWHGGVSYGPRLLLPMVPLLWLAAALSFDARRGAKIARRASIVLCAFGALIVLPGVAVDPMTYVELAPTTAAGEQRAIPLPVDRFERSAELQWEWRYAQPWAHWRLLRHRVALPDSPVPAARLFFSEGADDLIPVGRAQRGFEHFAWVFLEQRLGGLAWPALLVAFGMLAYGVLEALRGLDPTRP